MYIYILSDSCEVRTVNQYISAAQMIFLVQTYPQMRAFVVFAKYPIHWFKVFWLRIMIIMCFLMLQKLNFCEKSGS